MSPVATQHCRLDGKTYPFVALCVRDLPPNLDVLIAPAVKLLVRSRIKTFSSCQGGPGHCSERPFIRFKATRWVTVLAAAEALYREGFCRFDFSLVQRAQGLCNRPYSFTNSVEFSYGEILFDDKDSLIPLMGDAL